MNYYNNNELYHYGVPGMKWGHRKAQRLEAKYTRKLSRSGRARGAAEYERNAGDAAYKKHDATAKVFDKVAKKNEKSGNYLKAEAARRAAEAVRARGSNIKQQHDAAAKYLEKQADKLQEKANTFASKKRVDMGKDKIDSILKTSKQKGYEYRKASDEYQKETAMRERIGDNAYDTLERIRGRK